MAIIVADISIPKEGRAGFGPTLFPTLLVLPFASIFAVTMVPASLAIIVAGFDSMTSRIILYFLLAIFNLFIGVGLWKLQKWSRLVVIIFSPLGALAGLLTMIQGFNLFGIAGLFGLVISLSAGIYLLFNKEVKSKFLNKTF